MKTLIVSFVAAFFCLGLWLGGRMARRRWQATALRRRLTREVTEVLISKMSLEAIREGRTPVLMENSEYVIDSGVSDLWRNRERMDRATYDLALQTLRKLKAYREQWPRQARGELVASDGVTAADIEKAAREASEILKGL